MEIHILAALILILGLYMAWTMGASDLSNALGTVIGSKALTLKQAIICASLLEFLGAFFLGSHVSETIEGGIVNPQALTMEPKIYVLGMMSALCATAIWLHLGSFLKLPVSTTHSVVGSVAGFGLLIGGTQAIKWTTIGKIGLSWLFCPLISGSLAFLLFFLIQRRIFFAHHPLRAIKRFLPILLFVVASFFSFNLLFGGLKTLHLHISFKETLMISIIIGLLVSFVSFLFIIRLPSTLNISSLTKKILHLEKAKKRLSKKSFLVDDITTKTRIDKIAQNIQIKKTQYETSAEYRLIEKIFGYLQIFSACIVAFSHGANDVGNAIGPVSGAIHMLFHPGSAISFSIPLWLLLIGSSGIVLGLVTWGWRIVETIGHKITDLTPSRGFCAEFAAATVILFVSKLGIPISTTHALVGSVVGIALARGLKALNLSMVKSIGLTWLITLPVCSILCVVIFLIFRLIF